MKTKRLNRAQLADLRGTTKQAMGALLKRNGITAGDDGLFDPAEVERALNGEAGASGAMTLTEAIRRKESALARLRELEFEMRSGKYVDTAYAIEHLTRLVILLRSIVLQVPTRAVQDVADPEVKRAVFAAATRAKTEILRQLAGVTDGLDKVVLCPTCTAKVEKVASKYQFPKEAFPKGKGAA